MAKDDVYPNEVMAAGGVWMALLQAGVQAQPVMVDSEATNSLDLRLPFLKSIYRIRLELLPDTEDVRLDALAVAGAGHIEDVPLSASEPTRDPKAGCGT